MNLPALALALALPLAASGATANPVTGLVAVRKPDDLPDAAYALLKDYRVIWLGESHGTEEAPAFFLGIIKLLTRNNTLPIVALEIWRRNQTAIDEFLQSGNTEILRTRTILGYVEDGRGSAAMVKMLQSLRAIGVRHVLCIDPGQPTNQLKEDGMSASIIYALQREPGKKAVVLTGSYHSSLTHPPQDPTYRPAAYQVKSNGYSVINLLHRYESGTTWNRSDDEYKMRPVSSSAPSFPHNFYILVSSFEQSGHYGIIFSQKVTGSPPAYHMGPYLDTSRRP